MGIGYADSDKDSFWDLDLLLPKKQSKPAMKPFASTIQTAEVAQGTEGEKEAVREELRLTTPPAEVGSDVQEYAPAANRLLLRVRITRRRSEYNFYGQFRRDAQKYLTAEGEACAFAPFFSYIPQYAQLGKEQLAYYLYWRSALRRGEYLQTEESYFYLYVYEIINLPDFIQPKDGVVLLCKAWQAYRECFPRIDKYMAEWVADYCLVHGLPCPEEHIRSFLTKILPFASLREFYLGGMGDFSPRGVEMALAFFSDYRWQGSRYAEQHRALFEEHIPAALTPVLERLFKDNQLFRESARSRKAHDAFCGSLCAYNIKCRIEVEYYALQDIAAVRAGATAAVKYAENKLRALLSIKSRLAVQALGESYRAMIDAYFARAGERILPPTAKESPAYERLYDAPTKGVDYARAIRIEAQSWDTTKILVAEEEEKLPPTEVQKTDTKIEAASSFAEEEIHEDDSFSDEERRYLALLMADDRAALHHFLSGISALEEELAEGINEKAIERLGDVVLELGEDGYRMIEDYTEEVSQWIK